MQRNFSDSNANQPGPGSYSPKLSIVDKESGFLSHYRGITQSSFYHHDRQTINVPKNSSNLPGPGQYRLPSDFGYAELVKSRHSSTAKNATKSQIVFPTAQSKQES